MLQDQKSIQQPKRDRRDYEQIHRRNAVGMIAEKGVIPENLILADSCAATESRRKARQFLPSQRCS
jgi:hypothetical protein